MVVADHWLSAGCSVFCGDAVAAMVAAAGIVAVGISAIVQQLGMHSSSQLTQQQSAAAAAAAAANVSRPQQLRRVGKVGAP